VEIKKKQRKKKSKDLVGQQHIFSFLAMKANCILGYFHKKMVSWTKEITLFLLIALLRPHLA